MSTPTGKVERQYASFPVVNEDFCIVHLAIAAGAGAALLPAITTRIKALEAALGRNYPDMPKTIVISASSGNDIILVGTNFAGAGGVGFKIAAGSSMLIGFTAPPTDPLLYQCAGVCAVACYF